MAVWWWRARKTSSWDEAGTLALSACDLVHIHSLVSECEYPTHLTSPHPQLITPLHFLKEPQAQTHRLEVVTGIGWLACRAKRLLLLPRGFHTVCMCLSIYIYLYFNYIYVIISIRTIHLFIMPDFILHRIEPWLDASSEMAWMSPHSVRNLSSWRSWNKCHHHSHLFLWNPLLPHPSFLLTEDTMAVYWLVKKETLLRYHTCPSAGGSWEP